MNEAAYQAILHRLGLESEALPSPRAAKQHDRPSTSSHPLLVAGVVIEWESPLFGLLSASVLEVTNLSVTVQHPLTEHLATIPRAWVKRIEREQELA